ncbi:MULTISPECIES: YetF domain-containing protein [Paenibacillus]|uniref:YetF domain-containing protein n=1 Tax=Paenibacillus TaxID=44249 RepID=UPI000839205C|nr:MULTISPECIES: YetF domain-containing protein [Paenibacillus]GIP20806.1 hypothetical protein J22TS3_10810 [Paenibacillus sp. J22TS3]
MSAPISYAPLPLPLIVKGQVQDQNLERIRQNRFWLKNQIQTKGVTRFKEVLVCTVDHKGKLYIHTEK